MNVLQANSPSMISTAELQAIEGLYRAFSEGDIDLLDEVLSPDWVDIPLAPHQKPGREGFKPLVREFRTAFPDLRITVHQVLGTAGQAAVRAEITGTHQGEWFGIAPTGKPFSIRIHEFHELANGRITQTRHLEDWFGWLAQVGA